MRERIVLERAIISDLIQLEVSRPTRRTFMKTLGVAGAASGLAACQNPEHILPLLVPDPREEAGRPQFFATVCRECPAGCGMVARVNTGRTTKAEGNPDHPVNRGKLCLRGQTSVQGLYNPDRLKHPLLRDPHGNLRPTDWTTAMARYEAAVALAGDSIRWLGQLETGTMDGVIRQWLTDRKAPAPLYYEYFSYDVLRRAYQETHGTPIVPRFHMERARYILNFGAEFLETWISNVQFAGDFAAAHSFGHTPAPARAVFVGPRISLTGANADEWWPAKPGTEALLAWALLGEVGRRMGQPVAGPSVAIATAAEAAGLAPEVVALAAERLVENRPSLVLGPGYEADTRTALDCQIAVNRLNDLLGNTEVTIDLTQPHALSAAATKQELFALGDACEAGQVKLLLVHHANPGYHFPALRSRLAKAAFKISFASWMDETTQDADLVLPDLHYLESWGDYAPYPGVTGILQPTRIPVVDGHPTGDILLGGMGRFAVAVEAKWDLAQRQKGVNLTPHPIPAALRTSPITDYRLPITAFDGTGDLTLIVFPTVQLFDGRQANRTWAQEIAEPMSKIAWDGWCELHPATAARLDLAANDVVRLDSPHGHAEFPLFITTWIRPDCIGVVMGQGHSNLGMFANDCGDLAHKLQAPRPDANGLWPAQSVQVKVTRLAKRHELANLQTERLQWDKNMALAIPLAEAASELAREPLGTESFYHFHHPYINHRWGMAVDLSSCIGCNACQAACYAENNLAVWGRSSARSHREMTWIRVELCEGDQDHPSTALNPDLRFIPIPCQQCGNAPCEYVCPVFAAYHTDEGLNGQVYNRCVGTRYCSNNCIYKVRRFNWYTPQWPQPLDQQLNPQVTVRAKGVMEKCTFCVQRITQVELDSKTNGTPIKDGDIQTACMQTCPTDAIVFGDLLDPHSRVSRLAAHNRAYGMFAEENTYPAVHYLKKTKFELNRGSEARKPYGTEP